MDRTALITGLLGQDGSLLAELLLAKGYAVHGLVRSAPNPTALQKYPRLEQAVGEARLVFHEGDILIPLHIKNVIQRVEPVEIYNLAGQSHVGRSFEDPWTTVSTNGLGALNVMLTAHDLNPEVRIFQAGSADMFGNAEASPQDEATPLRPESPYASSKVLAHQLAQQFRAARGMQVWNGILYPHESTRRAGSFVIRKVTQGVAKILAGEQSRLALGNLASRRDWGSALDTVRAMWMMLQHSCAGDYVVATGYAHSVEELVDAAFGLVGLDWHAYIEIDPAFFRPADPQLLVGDASKIRTELGWEPQVSFEALISDILAFDLRANGLNASDYPRLVAHLTA
jgi:GDPmannose 4,6-dehydratase